MGKSKQARERRRAKKQAKKQVKAPKQDTYLQRLKALVNHEDKPDVRCPRCRASSKIADWRSIATYVGTGPRGVALYKCLQCETVGTYFEWDVERQGGETVGAIG